MTVELLSDQLVGTRAFSSSNQRGTRAIRPWARGGYLLCVRQIDFSARIRVECQENKSNGRGWTPCRFHQKRSRLCFELAFVRKEACLLRSRKSVPTRQMEPFLESIVKRTSIRGAMATVLLGACASSAIAQTFTPVTQAMLEHPDPADWLHMSRTYDQQRHSPLDQINKSNVGQLQMAWSRGLPIGAQESSPISL